jgi:hypothetical protein
MKYIGKKFNIPYAGGYSKFSDSSPKDGKGSLGSCAWDRLNLYFYEFHFSTKTLSFQYSYKAILVCGMRRLTILI